MISTVVGCWERAEGDEVWTCQVCGATVPSVLIPEAFEHSHAG